jgi:hypothetical protein
MERGWIIRDRDGRTQGNTTGITEQKNRQKPAPCFIEVLRIFSPAGLPNWYVALLKNARMQHGPGPLNVRRNSIYEQREYKYDRALWPFLFVRPVLSQSMAADDCETA